MESSSNNIRLTKRYFLQASGRRGIAREHVVLMRRFEKFAKSAQKRLAKKPRALYYRRMTPSGVRKVVRSDWISFGPNDTMLPFDVLRAIRWNITSVAIKMLLLAVFGRDLLREYSVHGIRFGKDTIRKLPHGKVVDIVYIVNSNTQATEKEILDIIDAVCAKEKKEYLTRTIAKRWSRYEKK